MSAATRYALSHVALVTTGALFAPVGLVEAAEAAFDARVVGRTRQSRGNRKVGASRSTPPQSVGGGFFRSWDAEQDQNVNWFLDRSLLPVKATYLRRLEGQEDRSWAKVAEAIGV